MEWSILIGPGVGLLLAGGGGLVGWGVFKASLRNHCRRLNKLEEGEKEIRGELDGRVKNPDCKDDRLACKAGICREIENLKSDLTKRMDAESKQRHKDREQWVQNMQTIAVFMGQLKAHLKLE
jgi:hypothetical protein